MTDTQVAIVGAGPAGLLLSHLLAMDGIESIVIDSRSRENIEDTVRAGILEHDTVKVLTETAASQRVLEDGIRHDGIELRFAGAGHRIDFAKLVGRGVWLYPQHEVLRDLIATRLAAGQALRFETSATGVDADADVVRVATVDQSGAPGAITAEFVVGADGSRSVVRAFVTGATDSGHFHEYPFAWFGILCEAPPSAPELIYSNSEHGFALISQRSATVQRMYLQCDPDLDPEAMSDAEVWEQFRLRVAPHDLVDGPIFQRDVLRFRSFVSSSLRRGRAALVGDAAHTVPPTGAKGLNLAVADVLVLAPALRALIANGDQALIDGYAEQALARVWKAQHFSWWMTQMLHRQDSADAFGHLRQLGELRSVVDSEAGQRYLAEAYTGWPMPGL